MINALAWLLANSPEIRFRDPSRAVELAKKAVELAPNDGKIWNTLGVAQYRVGDWNAAVRALQKVMEYHNGGDANDWRPLTMAYLRLENRQQAREWYDKAIEWMEKNSPKDVDLLRLRAEAEALLSAKKAP